MHEQMNHLGILIPLPVTYFPVKFNPIRRRLVDSYRLKLIKVEKDNNTSFTQFFVADIFGILELFRYLLTESRDIPVSLERVDRDTRHSPLCMDIPK